jgi:hypothetical protein
MTSFKQYLNERVIPHKIDYANKIVRNFISIIDSAIKDKDDGEKEFSSDEVHDIVNHYNEKYGDGDALYFSAFDRYNSLYFGIINGHARIEDGYIEIDLQEDDIVDLLYYYTEDKRDKQWLTFLKNLKEVILHEVVHFEQSFRRPEGVEYNQIPKLKKRYGDMLYFNKKDEIMAHAGGVVKQLRNHGYKTDKIKEMIRNPGKYQHILMLKSDSYEEFNKALAKDSPKLWKRFLKYVYQYLEEEK